MMLVGPGGVDKTRLVTRWPRPWSGRSPRELRSLSWARCRTRCSPTVVRWPSPTLRRGWTRLSRLAHREACGPGDSDRKRPIRRKGGFGVEAWGVGATHRVDFNDLMRLAGVTDQ
jgi:hypothetical protein